MTLLLTVNTYYFHWLIELTGRCLGRSFDAEKMQGRRAESQESHGEAMRCRANRVGNTLDEVTEPWGST